VKRRLFWNIQHLAVALAKAEKFPPVAIRELVINAIMHRDFAKTNSFITIEIFSDRIEIANPGGLLPEISVDRLI
jgi:predicted HTH transcriptional regulator